MTRATAPLPRMAAAGRRRREPETSPLRVTIDEVATWVGLRSEPLTAASSRLRPHPESRAEPPVFTNFGRPLLAWELLPPTARAAWWELEDDLARRRAARPQPVTERETD